MHLRYLYTAFVTLGVLAGTTACQKEPTVRSPEQLVEHGRYLVEKVGMCGDCHTPMGPQGPVRERHLMGAELPFAPTVPVPDWAGVALPIAGLPGYTDEQAVAVLMGGPTPRGARPRVPMPAFQFSEDDARAVVAYLRTLPSQP